MQTKLNSDIFLQYYNESTSILDLSGQNFTDSDLPEIIEFLKQHPYIIELNLSNNFISDSNGILASTTTLKKLDLSNNLIDREAIHSFAKNTSIVELDLSDSRRNTTSRNYIEDDALRSLLSNSVLKILKISDGYEVGYAKEDIAEKNPINKANILRSKWVLGASEVPSLKDLSIFAVKANPNLDTSELCEDLKEVIDTPDLNVIFKS